MALHNCKQGHEWIENNYIYKTSLLNFSKRSMDPSVDTWIHSNKITAGTDLVKLLDMPETASGSNVQSTTTTCYRNLTWQNKAWKCYNKCI